MSAPSASIAENSTTPEPPRLKKQRPSPPKNCPCEWCGAVFSKSGLGRHYDYWVYSSNPSKPDDKHTPEAVQRMKEIRKDARRLKATDRLDPKVIKARQNKRNYERHKGRHVEKKRAKRMSEMAKSMVLKEITKEISEISPQPTYLPLEHKSETGTLNFATLVYAFLPPPPPEASVPAPGQDLGSWGDRTPASQEYLALGAKFKDSELSVWSERLETEWKAWEALTEAEKIRACLRELGRALARSKLDAAKWSPYAKILGQLGGEELGDRITKWEGRATELREKKGRAEEVLLEKIWLSGGTSGSGEGTWSGGGRGKDADSGSSSGDDSD